ncbi:MAG: excinuclease ABC subunit UvrC [Candidatus Latescibacterota bacterium]
MKNEELTLKLMTLPSKPGVYLMKNEQGVILYVGKAKVLRNRVRSYFQQAGYDGQPKLQALLARIATFDTIVTDTEREALVLEAHLIKEHNPRYNINLKDDKKYPFLKITAEPYPRLTVVRTVTRDGGNYFGPYTDVRAMRNTLQTVRRLFPVRDCAFQLPGRRPARVCLNYHVRRCQGPCQNLVSQEAYALMIRQVVLLLSGRSDALKKVLREKMEEEARLEKFEQAAEIRDRLRDLERTTARQRVASSRMEDWDVLAVAQEDDEACGVVLEIREGKLLDKKTYTLGGTMGAASEEIISAFLTQFYVEAVTIPGEIHMSCPIPDGPLVADWLTEKRGGKVVLKTPQRGDKAKLLEMARTNAEAMMVERRFKRERLKDHMAHSVVALARDLHLGSPPRRIEAVDISNIQGADAVGSLVCFVDGRAKKSEYRRFKIRSVAGADDYAMMREVVTRRFGRLREESAAFPDLLLVDGGKGQLSSAVEALEKLNIRDQPVIGLAKRLEEVFVPGIPEAQMIPKVSSSLKLLQQIRDEAHRFAVAYHRKLRADRTLVSELDGIPGIGRARKTALLKHFGSVKRIAAAETEQIALVSRIGEKLAQEIKARLGDPSRTGAETHG